MEIAHATRICEEILYDFGLAYVPFEITPEPSQPGYPFNGDLVGTCAFRDENPIKIQLEEGFVLLNREHVIKDVLLHEIAHALIGPSSINHNREWKSLYKAIGGIGDKKLDREIFNEVWTSFCEVCKSRTTTPSPRKPKCIKCNTPIPHSMWARTPRCVGKYY